MQHQLLKIIPIAFILLSLQSSAQQIVPFNDFAQSNILWNPGETGIGGGTNAFFQYRHQWAGFEGAPKNMSIGVDHYFGKRVGLGMSLFSEQIGPLSNYFWNASYAYHLPFENGTISFGLNASLISYNGNFTELQTIEENDLAFSEDLHAILPNFGTGLIYYTDQFKIGLSIPRLLENKLDKENTSVNQGELLERAYYGFASYNIDLNSTFDLEPSMMFLYDALKGGVVGVDVKVRYMNKLGAGMGYNSAGWLNGGINFAFDETFRFFYTYSWNNSVNNAYFSGSHEFTIKMIMNKEK